jgi:hypothetical protein
MDRLEVRFKSAAYLSVRALIELDVGAANHFSPFVVFLDDEIAKLHGRHRHRLDAKVGERALVFAASFYFPANCSMALLRRSGAGIKADFRSTFRVRWHSCSFI